MSGGRISNYTFLAYIEEDIDNELKDMVVSERYQDIIIQMKLLYWELYKLTKTLDKTLSGEYDENKLYIAFNQFRYNTGYTPREGSQVGGDVQA